MAQNRIVSRAVRKTVQDKIADALSKKPTAATINNQLSVEQLNKIVTNPPSESKMKQLSPQVQRIVRNSKRKKKHANTGADKINSSNSTSSNIK